MRLLFAWALAGGALFAGGAPAAAEGVEVTYLGNEGFLIAAGDVRVVVDALFDDGIKGYPTVPPGPRRPPPAEQSRGAFRLHPAGG